MTSTFRFALLAVFLALPMTGRANGWRYCPGSASFTSTEAAVGNPRDGRALCYTFINATDPPRADMRACKGGVDVLFNGDTTTSSGASTGNATLLVYKQCPNETSSGLIGCSPIAPTGVLQTLTGDPTGNRDAIYGISSDFLAFDITNPDPTLAEIRLICH